MASSSKTKSWKHGVNFKKQQYSKLVPGIRGFLCTCNGQLQERQCVRDAYNVLNQYADNLYKNWSRVEEVAVADGKNGDVDSSLTRELLALKQQKTTKEMKFQSVDSGAKGVVFIKTSIPDPRELVEKIVQDVYNSQTQLSKCLLRLLPVEMTCKAYLEDITEATSKIFPKYFSEGNKTFAIVYTHRNNNTLSKMALIEALAKQITDLNETNTVNLTKPHYVVLIEVIKGICCLAVVTQYYELKKYNLLELCTKNERKIEDLDKESDSSELDDGDHEIIDFDAEESDDDFFGNNF